MSEILVNTIKKADGTGSITVPADSGTLLTSVSDVASTKLTGTLDVDASGNVTVNSSGTTTPTYDYSTLGEGIHLRYWDQSGARHADIVATGNTPAGATQDLRFFTNSGGSPGTATERMRIDSSGNLLIGATSSINPFSASDTGIQFGDQKGFFQRSSGAPLFAARQTNDGTIIALFAQGVEEGNITVSGTTVSYNGGHLARWSRLADDSKDKSIVKGTVMTNLDAMVEWSHDSVAEVLDEEGNVVTEAKEAYTEDNEQLNKMAVSSVEGDPNVAGVFVNWDEDDDDFNDMNIAMTGDMVIRIAQGTTVARGDLLMSAGDGTAKPQGDDIVRSKTIAKVTSTHVSHTYDDGSYLVPCVLMAC